MQFLEHHGFRHEAPYTEGIPYMSREEEAAARAIRASEVSKRSNLKDIEIKDNDTVALTFLRSFRTAVQGWLAQGHVGLNLFRLHQLIRSTVG